MSYSRDLTRLLNRRFEEHVYEKIFQMSFSVF